MANIIKIEVPDITDVLTVYNKVKVYKAAAVDGTYAEITNSSTWITLNVQDNLYSYTDVSGAPTDWYKTSYYNSISTNESMLSNAVPGSSTNTNQLTENMQVVITLDPSISSLTGTSIGDSLQFFFTTKYNPLYSSVRKVRLEIGSFVQNLDDEAINFAIYEASLASDQLSWFKNAMFTGNGASSPFFIWARREWVTCTASSSLLMNVISGLKSKRLDNMEVTYDFITRGQTMLDKVQACIDKWEKELKSGGKGVQTPTYFVKGELDPEAAHVGRMWEKGPGILSTAASNARYKPFHARRYIGGFRRNAPGINTLQFRKIS